MATITVDRMVKAYVKIREARQELQARFDEEDGALKSQLEAIERKLLDRCQEDGADGFKTTFGTVSRRVRTRYWPADWSAMTAWIKERDQLDLFEKRLHQGNVAKYLEEHPDDAPPSLQVDRKYAVTVTKPRNRS